MRILIPIKRVVDPYAKVRALPSGEGLDTAGLKFEINPFDEIALEEAVRMKERGEATELIAITIGGSECEEQLRKSLAIGADKAILVETTSPLDPSAVSAELAAWAAELQPDLILMGKQGTENDENQTGQRLAAKLDWPQATFASKIEKLASGFQVTRETDLGEEVVEVAQPAVITVDLRLNEPRYIALPGIIKARSKPLERATPKTALTVKVKTRSYANPPARGAGIRVNSVDELVAAIAAKGVL